MLSTDTNMPDCQNALNVVKTVNAISEAQGYLDDPPKPGLAGSIEKLGVLAVETSRSPMGLPAAWNFSYAPEQAGRSHDLPDFMKKNRRVYTDLWVVC
jgi:hypothetical protein